MRSLLAMMGLAIAFAPATALSSGGMTRAVVIASLHDETAKSSEIEWVEIGGASGLRTVRTATVPHGQGAIVRADVLPGTDSVAIVADEEGARDPEYGSALFRFDTTSSTLRQLATGVVHASRPLASIDGAVYVERGSRGPNRVDAVTIDAVDAAGATRTVCSWNGFALHLAGEIDRSLVVYRVGPTGAEIVTIDRASGSLRVVAAIPPFARDFSVDLDRNAIVFSNRDASDARLWVVERMDLATGARTRLHHEQGDSPAPFALPNGDVAWTAPRRSGLWISGRAIAPLGPGFDGVRAAATVVSRPSDPLVVMIAHVPSGGGFDSAVILDGSKVLAFPTNVRIEPVGFVGSSRVVR